MKFAQACASANFNNFEAEINYNSAPFNSDNIFHVEMSNKDGDFSTPTNLKSINNQNTSFKFDVAFTIPTDSYGENYKIRVRSTSPEKISPLSDNFQAYYMSTGRLILNNFQDVVLCGTTTKEVTIDVQNGEKYQWYKDGVKHELGDYSLIISEPGLYYCEIYYGICASSAVSNIITVTREASLGVKIKGDSIIEICAGNTHVLEANIDNANYKYSWYKGNTKITGLPEYSPTYTISNSSQYGEYFLEVETANSCTSRSAITTVQSTTSNFNVNADSDTSMYLLSGETKTLKINYDAVASTIAWYKDGTEISSSNNKELIVNEEGEYVAKVTTTAACPTTKESPIFNVWGLKSIHPTIEPDASYTDCSLDEVTLTFKEIKIIDKGDNEYILTDNLYEKLSFQWYKDGVIVAGESSSGINVNNFEENGAYQIKVSNGAVLADSNIFNLKLQFIETSPITSLSTVICEGKKIALSTKSNSEYRYQWFKDDVIISGAVNHEIEITELGSYKVEVSGYYCSLIKELEITEFDESIVTVDVPLNIVIAKDEEKEITGNGADSYVWYDDQNNIISNLASVIINKEGVYLLRGLVDGCSVEIEITVEVENNEAIPNTITFNGDGVNDNWELPNRFSYKDDVEILIYSTSGSLMFKTKNYKNNWPSITPNTKIQSLFYYLIKKKNKIVEKGTISIIQ